MGQPTAEERSMARDFVMARLAACRSNLAHALESVDIALQHFIAPETDKRGKSRRALLEQVDETIGESAHAIQMAQAGWDGVDPEEGEPDEEDDDDDDDEEDDDAEEEGDEEEADEEEED